MGSTFMGLETSKRGLYTQQSALYTTGHNISNANTLGYSRQRVNMEATLGYPGTGLNAPKIPGHLGTGVQAQSVQRIRDQFIDRQYRQETNKLGYWEAKSNAISQMEDILSEPSEFGLNTSLDQFWKSLQDLSANPENAGARKVVVQRGIAVAESFNYINKQLTDIQGNLKNEIRVSTNDVNSILNQIASINEQIQQIEPNGYLPNDLYDARDTLLDELNTYFPIEIEYSKSGGNALAIAEGAVKVSIKTNSGLVEVVDGKDAATLKADGLNEDNSFEPFTQFTVVSKGNAAGGTISYSDLEKTKGKLLATIDSYGYSSNGTTKGFYPEMLKNLDDMAVAFAEKFNEIHKGGTDLNGDVGKDFFVSKTNGQISASTISVDSMFESDPSLLAASSSTGKEEGNGANALLLSNMKFAPLTIGSTTNTTVQSFYQSIIGKLGVDGEQANRLAYNSATIKLTVENNRAAVSSVSLDEEMTNMIIFQQAYNASARMITVVDETLDKIINGMGRVGL
ncbi:flagellar hook-associated protein FlgK [Psychrobacillus sp. NEAU-3TGS]|uniref:flagellar hook-associated protein FlgK n=1 Tax=Psychrobacillus sp. NEAU-3TGS TaxID=2995412 RepID=UPI002497FF07|nr:flagellar hook-associated protein FlgK [Psychrobacillus sp. NEAU-3TGS]MDI2589759.1 flagellar hook-associated protein FlgK [Psychrobacillus sp. NEAU-3TGS]